MVGSWGYFKGGSAFLRGGDGEVRDRFRGPVRGKEFRRGVEKGPLPRGEGGSTLGGRDSAKKRLESITDGNVLLKAWTKGVRRGWRWPGAVH